ncbi:MAG: hypothetical protein PUC37_06825 [Spirochaetales bacterium]|nr:hypothetical protein [Spirochaetales bacterium]
MKNKFIPAIIITLSLGILSSCCLAGYTWYLLKNSSLTAFISNEKIR